LKNEETGYAIHFHVKLDFLWQGYSSRAHLLLLGLPRQWGPLDPSGENPFQGYRWPVSQQNSAKAFSKKR
jgi:hypothetical protein